MGSVTPPKKNFSQNFFVIDPSLNVFLPGKCPVMLLSALNLPLEDAKYSKTFLLDFKKMLSLQIKFMQMQGVNSPTPPNVP